MYLLDTSILSAPLKPKPDMKVLGWLREASKSRPYLSVVTIHESRFGFELLQEGRKRRDLEHWFEGEILPRFAGRILPITEAIADECGRLLAATRKASAEAELGDALIAATARVHGLTVATLNRDHFARLSVDLVDFE
jgi:predicted nucleic acid-binding protein